MGVTCLKIHFIASHTFLIHVCSTYIFSAIWFCPVCKDEYDTEEIEYSLLDAVNRQSMSYVLQDVKCLKCKGVSLKGHEAY